MTQLLEFRVEVERYTEDAEEVETWNAEFQMEVPINASPDEIKALAESFVRGCDRFDFYKDEVVRVDYEDVTYGPFLAHPFDGLIQPSTTTNN
jgi:hypothetical protein